MTRRATQQSTAGKGSGAYFEHPAAFCHSSEVGAKRETCQDELSSSDMSWLCNLPLRHSELAVVGVGLLHVIVDVVAAHGLRRVRAGVLMFREASERGGWG